MGLTGNDGHGKGKVLLELPRALLDRAHGIEAVLLLPQDEQLSLPRRDPAQLVERLVDVTPMMSMQL